MRRAVLLPSLALGFALAGCGPTFVGDFPRGPVTVSHLEAPAAAPLAERGWMRVEEPGWFVTAAPGTPKTTFETIPVQGARIQLKAISASDGQTVWTWVRYFEVSTLTTMLDRASLLETGKDNFLSIPGVHLVRQEERVSGGPQLDFLCTVDPHSPLDVSDKPMTARVRAYGHGTVTNRITFAIAVWPSEAPPDSAQAFFDGFHVSG